jgi:hypothetical protein
MITRMARQASAINESVLSRRRVLTLLAGAATAAALAPVLAACDGDDDAEPEDSDDEDVAAADSDDADDELQEAMEQAEEETDVELDALDDDNDEERTFPDDFPDNIPVPDDAEIISDMSYSRDDEREIYISFVSHEDRSAWVDTYDNELATDYEMDSEYRNDDLDTGEWDFNGHGWEWARVALTNPQPDAEGDFQVLVILRNYEP